MLASLPLFALGVARVIAQASYGSPENSPAFTYWGCAVVDAAAFGKPIVFSDGVVAPEACQQACLGQIFAALSPDGCRCGDDPSGIKSLDEKACNFPCVGDPNSGMCGGICPEHGPGVSNVFTSNIVLISNGDPPGADIPDPPPGPPAPPTSSGPALPFPPPQTASSALSGETSQQSYIPSSPGATISSGNAPPQSPVTSAPISTLTPQVPSAPTSSIPRIPTSWIPGNPSSSQVLTPPNATLPGGNSKEFSDPPLPTLVTGSDSTSFEISIFITLTEALLVAAIMF